MVVDDDEEILRILSRTLELEGYDVVIAADGSTALVLLEKRKPDLVILDIMMPGKSGIEVLEELRARHCQDRRISLYQASSIRIKDDCLLWAFPILQGLHFSTALPFFSTPDV